MNISIIGTGYVGLVTGACLAEYGMNTLCMDSDREKIKMLENYEIPIYEPGLDSMVRKNHISGSLAFTDDIRIAVAHGDVIFIAVNTPTLDDNKCDIRYVLHAAQDIASYMEDYKAIVTKSTVPVGTGRLIIDNIRQILSQRNKHIEFDVVSNPEFLREGSAVKDFINPDRIVVGAESEKAVNLMREVYKVPIFLGTPFISTNLETAEMVKYASNAFLAARVSFINEIANICELCRADVTVVSKAMGLDSRIGPKFLNPGPGFGGSCFPKDTRALLGMAESYGYSPLMIKSVIDVNRNQSIRMFEKIKNTMGSLENKTVTILGIAFKPDTDDTRETPAVPIIRALLEHGTHVKVYDPHALNNAKKLYPDLNVDYCEDLYGACIDSDCIVLVTEWNEFRHLDFSKLKFLVRAPVFIDLRNVYEPDYVKNSGFYYQGVGRK